MDSEILVKELVQKVKAGNAQAFRALMENFQHLAFTVAMNIVKNREDAEEVVQDAFVKAYKNILQFGGDSKFSSWLFKIVYNTALTKIRKKNLPVQSLDENEYEQDFRISNPNGWDSLVLDDQQKYIGLALDKLNETDKNILTLYYLAEEDLNEISKITNENKSTIKVRLHRARAKLFEQLNLILKEELKTLV